MYPCVLETCDFQFWEIYVFEYFLLIFVWNSYYSYVGSPGLVFCFLFLFNPLFWTFILFLLFFWSFFLHLFLGSLWCTLHWFLSLPPRGWGSSQKLVHVLKSDTSPQRAHPLFKENFMKVKKLFSLK